MSSPSHLPLSCSDLIHNDCNENRTLIWLSSHQLQRVTFDLDFSSHLLVSTRYQHWISLGAMDYVTGESRLVTGHNRWCHQTQRHSAWAGFHVPVSREYANGPIWSHSHYHGSHIVPVWPTQYWAGTTCNPPAINKCGDATSLKTPDEQVMIRQTFESWMKMSQPHSSWMKRGHLILMSH
jgi:hypothetical protein